MAQKNSNHFCFQLIWAGLFHAVSCVGFLGWHGGGICFQEGSPHKAGRRVVAIPGGSGRDVSRDLITSSQHGGYILLVLVEFIFLEQL